MTRGPRTILIVDDDEMNRYMLGLLLRDHGFEVESVGALGLARERVAQARYDVVIVDLFLPDGLGTELVPLIREAQPEALVTMFSGSSDQPIEAGADLSFRKGSDPQAFVDRLLELLDASSGGKDPAAPAADR